MFIQTKLCNRLKLYKCVKLLRVSIPDMLKNSEELETIIAMEKHLGVRTINSSIFNSTWGTSLTMSNSTKGALKIAGLSISALYRAFQNAKHTALFDALFFITFILKESIAYYLAEENRGQITTQNKSGKPNDFLYCVCSMITYKLGIYVFPPRKNLINDGSTIINADHPIHSTSIAPTGKPTTMGSHQDKDHHVAKGHKMVKDNVKSIMYQGDTPERSARKDVELRPRDFYRLLSSCISEGDDKSELELDSLRDILRRHLTIKTTGRFTAGTVAAFPYLNSRDVLKKVQKLVEYLSVLCHDYVYSGYVLECNPYKDTPSSNDYFEEEEKARIIQPDNINTILVEAYKCLNRD